GGRCHSGRGLSSGGADTLSATPFERERLQADRGAAGLMATSTMLEAAMEYRQLGLSVIPVGHDKRPLVGGGEFQTEAPHSDHVAVWWDQWPEANIGCATGAVSGLVVLDADGPEGLSSLKALDTPATTWLSKTGRPEGGWQQFFAHPGTGIRIG